MSLEEVNTVFIKVEVPWDGNEGNEESVPDAGVFSGHLVKKEFSKQQPTKVLTLEERVSEIKAETTCKTDHTFTTVKKEIELDSELPYDVLSQEAQEGVVNKTEEYSFKGDVVNKADNSLYEGHTIKEELVLGPELLQPRDSVFNHGDHLKKDLKVENEQVKVEIKIENCYEENGFQDDTNLLKPSTSQDVLNTEIHKSAHKKLDKKSINRKKKFTCIKCNATYSKKVNLKRHQLIHCGKKSHVCKYCNASFSKTSHFQVHLRIHSGEKPFKCTHCDCAYTENSSLKIHLRTHSGVKPYECDYCRVRFRHKSSLKGHITTHMKEKPFKCTECSSAFSLKRGLRDHLRTHTGERPYKCIKCDAGFTVASGLRNHRKTCGVKYEDLPYKCDHCPAAFSQNCYLKRHYRTHTGERPYKCTICDYSSATSNNLKNHIFRHSGQKPFACEECAYRGASKSNLTQHVRKYHNDHKHHLELF